MGRIAQWNALLVKGEIVLQQLGYGELTIRFRALRAFPRSADRLRKLRILSQSGREHAVGHKVAAGSQLKGMFCKVEGDSAIAHRNFRGRRQNPGESERSGHFLRLESQCFPPLRDSVGNLP